MYTANNPNICSAIILDSPFSNLEELIVEMGQNKTGLP